jgi:hypothetical protein
LRAFLTRQRVPIGAIRILDPARETRIALAFAVAYIGVAFVTGWIERMWPVPLWGATSLTSDATYKLGFKIGLLLIVPAIAIRRAGYGTADLLLGWRPTVRSVAILLACFAAGFYLNASRLDPIRAAVDGLPPARRAAGWGSDASCLFSAGIPEARYRWGLRRGSSAWDVSPRSSLPPSSSPPGTSRRATSTRRGGGYGRRSRIRPLGTGFPCSWWRCLRLAWTMAESAALILATGSTRSSIASFLQLVRQPLNRTPVRRARASAILPFRVGARTAIARSDSPHGRPQEADRMSFIDWSDPEEMLAPVGVRADERTVPPTIRAGSFLADLAAALSS